MKEDSICFDESWKFRVRAWNSSFSIVILVGFQSPVGGREILFFNGVDLAFLSTDWMTGLRVDEISGEDLLVKFPQLAGTAQAGKRGFAVDSEGFSGFIFGSKPKRRPLLPGQEFEEVLAHEMLSDVLGSDDEV